MMWLIPFSVTMAAFVFAMVYGRGEPGMYGSGLIFNVLVWCVAAIPPLVAWLIWAVLT